MNADYERLLQAARDALAQSLAQNPRDSISTQEALREGRVMQFLTLQMPADLRPAVEQVIADFDRNTLPVPVWDVVREPPLAVPNRDLCGTAVYRSAHGAVTLSPPQFRGRYSKFRIGMDDAGALWGVKQMRCERTASPDIAMSRHPLTQLPMAMIVREVLNQKTLAPALQPLRVLRRGSDVYVMMPMLQETLHSAVGRKAAGLQEAGRQVAVRTAEAIRYCHARGYVHADVKLDNVLCAADGALVLCDFAMATKIGTGNLAAAAQRGTPQTTAPEIVADQPFSAAVDVWSLGILLCEMLAGAGAANPFAAPPSADAAARWTYAQQQQQKFAAWRTQVMSQGAWGAARLQQVAAEANEWSTFLRGCAQADADLAALVLDKMLVTDAAQRASIFDCCEALTQLPAAKASVWPLPAAQDKARARTVMELNIARAQGATR